jgi:hypothetical protein
VHGLVDLQDEMKGGYIYICVCVCTCGTFRQVRHNRSRMRVVSFQTALRCEVSCMVRNAATIDPSSSWYLVLSLSLSLSLL